MGSSTISQEYLDLYNQLTNILLSYYGGDMGISPMHLIITISGLT